MNNDKRTKKKKKLSEQCRRRNASQTGDFYLKGISLFSLLGNCEKNCFLRAQVLRFAAAICA